MFEILTYYKRKNMKKIHYLMILIALLIAEGCKKDMPANTTGINVDLMEGAFAYTGTYPDLAALDFEYDGKTVNMNAFKGQYIIFFKQGTSASDAGKLIGNKGAKILAQIPQIGFYLVENNVSDASSFISSIQTDAIVDLISPNVPAYPKAGALVLDDCGNDHGVAVQATLSSCNGNVSQCKDITFKINNITASSSSLITHGIVDEANKNKSGPTYINLSFNGGLPREDDYDFTTLSKAEQETFERNYYFFMTNVLMSVAAVRDEYRKNLIITIAAGNENYDISGMMDYFRQRPRMADILRDNVLIVSTEKLEATQTIPGLHANHAYNDDDVVVLNNDEASRGSSLAAPCALGILQDIVAKTGVSAGEALKAVKKASWLLPKREVKLANALAMLSAVNYVTSSKTLIGYSSINDCTFKMDYRFDNIEVAWNGSKGSIKMPVTLYWSLPSNPTNDCQTGNEPSAYTVMYGELTGSDNAITTSSRIAGRFRFTVPNAQGPAIEDIPQFFSLLFTGIKHTDGSITGTLSCAKEVPSLSFPETLQITLTK